MRFTPNSSVAVKFYNRWRPGRTYEEQHPANVKDGIAIIREPERIRMSADHRRPWQLIHVATGYYMLTAKSYGKALTMRGELLALGSWRWRSQTRHKGLLRKAKLVVRRVV